MWSTSIDCYQNYILSPLNTHIHRYIHTAYTRAILEGARTHTHIRTYIHITQTYTHIYTGTDKHIHTHTHACKQTYMYMMQPIHTYCMYVRMYLFQDSLPAHDEGTTCNTF